MIPGLRHTEDPGCRDDRKMGLIRTHEFEDPDGSAPAFGVNQAAARERMPHSRRISLTFSSKARSVRGLYPKQCD